MESTKHIEVTVRPDGHAIVRIPEDEAREVDLGFAPLDKLKWTVVLPDFQNGRGVQVDIQAIIKKAFWAGLSHAHWRMSRFALRDSRGMKRKLK